MSEANLIVGDDGLYKLGDARNMARNTSNAANREMQILKHSAFDVSIDAVIAAAEINTNKRPRC